MDTDTAEGDVIHPMALDGTGLEVEREVASAAEKASLRMITRGQLDWALDQKVAAFVPVFHHIEAVQMVGVARLRYRPRTSRTLAFAAQEARWREVIARMNAIAKDGTSG